MKLSDKWFRVFEVLAVWAILLALFALGWAIGQHIKDVFGLCG